MNRASRARTRRPVGALDSADDETAGSSAGAPPGVAGGEAAGPAASVLRSGRTLRSDTWLS
ncbi:hypothetical protein Athai_27680 [Actinocatenispora thailandica]|uniref:Uncharacterized protein n=1 Tax=Actinocatenispora thailandica TaxID=227318 RepID=A0A7R7DP16_9ACTN|nr:hypothetical protein Athai_27680 [Actinocatenispora thailandica]